VLFLRPVYLCWVAFNRAFIDSGTYGSAYGPAGSLIVILVWVYYTAAILYFGAQFTKTYAEYTSAELNQLIMPFMWSNLKRKIVKVLPNTETPDPEVVFSRKEADDKVICFFTAFSTHSVACIETFFKLKEIYFKIILKKQVSLAKSRHAISIWFYSSVLLISLR
jgi:hypothetical protein